MSRKKILSSLGLLAVGAVLAGSTTAVAATGGALVLGRDNTAGATTILRNSGTAANLTLPAARAGQPPLAVSGAAGKVANLNSDKLDGLDSTAFSLAAAGRVGSIEAFGEPYDVDDDGVVDAWLAAAVCPTGTKLTGGGHEVYTTAGAVVSRAGEDSAWLVATLPDAGTATDDVVAVAQCYNPRGAVAGAVPLGSPTSVVALLGAEERAGLARLAARR